MPGRHSHRAREGPILLHMKGDLRGLTCLGGDPVELPSRPEHDGRAIRRPVHRRIDAVDGPGLLHVSIEPIEERSLLAGLEVKQHEDGLEAHAPDVGEGLPVWRGGGSDGAA